MVGILTTLVESCITGTPFAIAKHGLGASAVWQVCSCFSNFLRSVVNQELRAVDELEARMVPQNPTVLS